MRTVLIERRRVKNVLDTLTRKQQLFSASFLRRTDLVSKDSAGNKVVLAPKGSVRRMVCKRKPNLNPTANWRSKGGKLPFNPTDHELYHVYTVEGKLGNDGRGNHWGFICLRTVFEIIWGGMRYKVV